MSTWKAAERKIASILSKYGQTNRIPINGRKGPDLLSNDLGLSFEVKHGIQVPVRLWEKPVGVTGKCCGLYYIEISKLDDISLEAGYLAKDYKIIQRWWRQATDGKATNEDACLILHHKNIRYENSLIFLEEKWILEWKFK